MSWTVSCAACLHIDTSKLDIFPSRAYEPRFNVRFDFLCLWIHAARVLSVMVRLDKLVAH
jgi:hypothetical protein